MNIESSKSGIRVCDECGSDYYALSSKMRQLCPQCSHLLYGYEPCDHTFANGKCSKCFWDGSKMKLRSTEMPPLSDSNAKVIESIFSISGAIIVILQCTTGLIKVGTKLISDKGETWIIVENNLLIGRQSDIKLQERVTTERLFMYRLENHQSNLIKPEIGTMLKVDLI